MPWILLVIAGGLETIWAVGLSENHGFSSLLPSLATVAAMLGSFGLLGWAFKSLPRGIGAALGMAVGALGIVLIGGFWLGQGMNAWEIGCITLMTGGIVGLRLATKT
ncbi:MAG TPA: multidrug efflux SMR transporter [Dongiaceae bacterium]|nr:multidrug efflux SMR transporter [Dongiaceae bacterium]